MNCSKCGTHMDVQVVSETKRRSIFVILLYIVLLFVPIIGWIALFKILGGSRKVKGVSYAVCKTCGNRKKL